MKSLRRLAHHAGPAWEVPRDLLLGRYPDFVTGGPLARGDVPVFIFHSLEPESFGRQLRYLAENDYCTLAADRYFCALMGACKPPDRAEVPVRRERAVIVLRQVAQLSAEGLGL